MFSINNFNSPPFDSNPIGCKTSKHKQLKYRVKILQEKGYSYRKISKKLGCSIGTISYHNSPYYSLVIRVRDFIINKSATFNPNLRSQKKKIYDVSIGLRGKARSFMYGNKSQRNKIREGKMEKINKPNYTPLDFLKHRWPKFEYKDVRSGIMPQAVNQRTKELDFYSNGEPILYPYIRCYYSDKIVNSVENTHLDHLDGDNTNNAIENGVFCLPEYNQMKSNSTLLELKEMCLRFLKTTKKYELNATT
tara:strand:- start:2312 stop:3058 length:747 start_codon:yes stop_codon:yes gene_type:complete